MEKQDLYTRITNRIVAELEAGTGPWLKPWNAEHAAGRTSALSVGAPRTVGSRCTEAPSQPRLL
jgi:antirestriction protein ArdC